MKMNKNSITLLLIGLYFFLTPLGDLLKIPIGTSLNLGLTTLILLMIIGININSVFNVLFNEKILFFWLILIIWLLMTVLISYDPIVALTRTSMILIYLFLASSVAAVRLDEQGLSRLILFLLIGATVSSVATIIDFIGLVNIPVVNKSKEELATRTVFGSVIQATGFFSNRSAMAAFFSLIMPVPFLLIIQSGRKFFSLYILGLYTVFLSCFICLILTHNRSGIIATLISISVISFFIKSGKSLLLLLLKLLILFIALLSVLNLIFPEVISVYKSLFGLGDFEVANTAILEESDNLRISLFLYSLENMANNPMGNGLTHLPLPYSKSDVVDPHNNFTQLIWAGGIFAICWIITFTSYLFFRMHKYKLKSFNADNKYYYIFVAGLLSFFIGGLVHTTLYTGLAWVFFGLLLNVMRIDFRKKMHRSKKQYRVQINNSIRQVSHTRKV